MTQEMMDGFTTAEIETGTTTVFVRSSGSGPPLLLLHGFPETHLMWRGAAPLLTRRFTVVCADLRGYGQSGCPASTPDHAPYAKRAIAADMVAVMQLLGFQRFAVAGHDRGGRVAYRLALDHPDRVQRLAVLDVLPIETVWERADDRLALGFWPWSLLAQPEPLPERILAAAAEAIVDNARAGMGFYRERIPGGNPRRLCRSASRSRSTRTRSARNIAPPPASTANTTDRIAPAAGASLARSLRCGALPARSAPGTTGMAARSRCGGNGPTTSAARRSMAAISFRKNCPSRPPTRSAGFLARLEETALISGDASKKSICKCIHKLIASRP